MLSVLALQEVLEGKSEPLDDLLAEMAADRGRGQRPAGQSGRFPTG
jgi:hypothetical protein